MPHHHAAGAAGGQLTSDPERVADAAERSRDLAHRLADTPPPNTPLFSVPFVPEVAQFLSQLQASRASHHAAARSLGFFFRTPPRPSPISTTASLTRSSAPELN